MAKYCTKCGSQCADQATYCPRCGAMLPQRAVEGGTVSHKKRNHTWIVGLVAGVSVLVIVLVSGLAMLMYSKWKDNSTNSDKNILTNQSADEGDPGVDDLNIPYFEGQTAISRGQEGDFEYEEYEDGICQINVLRYRIPFKTKKCFRLEIMENLWLIHIKWIVLCYRLLLKV